MNLFYLTVLKFIFHAKWKYFPCLLLFVLTSWPPHSLDKAPLSVPYWPSLCDIYPLVWLFRPQFPSRRNFNPLSISWIHDNTDSEKIELSLCSFLWKFLLLKLLDLKESLRKFLEKMDNVKPKHSRSSDLFWGGQGQIKRAGILFSYWSWHPRRCNKGKYSSHHTSHPASHCVTSHIVTQWHSGAPNVMRDTGSDKECPALIVSIVTSLVTKCDNMSWAMSWNVSANRPQDI